MGTNLKGLFGGGEETPINQDQRTRAQDFVQRYTTGDPTEGYSEEEARDAFESVARRASPETMQRAAREAVNNLKPDQRAQFAEMLKQRQAGQGTVQIQRAGEDAGGGGGGGGGLDDMLGGLLGGGAAGGGLGGLLGGLLGGGGGRSGGGLDDLLGGMGGGDQPRSQTRFEQRGGGGGGGEGGGSMLGGLGDLMGSPIGKAIIGGIAAYSMKEMIDKN